MHSNASKAAIHSYADGYSPSFSYFLNGLPSESVDTGVIGDTRYLSDELYKSKQIYVSNDFNFD